MFLMCVGHRCSVVHESSSLCLYHLPFLIEKHGVSSDVSSPCSSDAKTDRRVGRVAAAGDLPPALHPSLVNKSGPEAVNQSATIKRAANGIAPRKCTRAPARPLAVSAGNEN